MQVIAEDYAHLNVLLAGCGSIGRRHATVLGELNVRRLTACDPDEAKWPEFLQAAPSARMARDFDEALRSDRFDAVFIRSIVT